MRTMLICAAAGAMLAACSTDAGGRYDVTASSSGDAAAAAALISAYRTSKGLSPVRVDSRLNRAAEHQARVVAAAGKLSHGNFMDRMNRFGILSYAAAENLSAGHDTVGEAVSSWKASRHHNENLLIPEARTIGLARADAKGGYGRYWALVLGK
jgi:uncharacterized protein YkwD